jgi:hypothetical protein
MIAAELAQRCFVELTENIAQSLGIRITGRKTLSVILRNVRMRVFPCLWLISPSWLRWRLSRPALLMLFSLVPASDSIIPPGPNGNLAAQHIRASPISGAGRRLVRGQRAPGAMLLCLRLRQHPHHVRRANAGGHDVSCGCWPDERRLRRHAGSGLA